MTEEKQKQLAKLQAVDLQEWGSYDEVLALGQRLKMLLPGGDKMSGEQAMAAAQYFMSIGANPFRGESYAYVDKRGKLVFVDGYKLLTRWAGRECPYVDRYVPMKEDEIGDGDVGVWCTVLREDKTEMMRELTKAGAPWGEAYGIAATKAGGVVRSGEQANRNPPTGWTWLDVARKRALKNALNLSHGMPTMKELSKESWLVDNVETAPQDWEGIDPDIYRPDAEREALHNAQERLWKEKHPEAAAEQEAMREPDHNAAMPAEDMGRAEVEQETLFPEETSTLPDVPETWMQFLMMAPTIGFTEDQALDLRAEWSREGEGITVADAWDHLIDAKAAMEGA